MKPSLDGLTAHGANPERLCAALGVSPPPEIIDFSTNTSVLPWPFLPALDLQALASRYPDPDCLELRRLVAQREGVSLGNVLFTNGTNEALYLLASLGQGASAAVVQPAYPEYRRALAAFGTEAADVFSLEAGAGFGQVFLSNPCNPTGTVIPPDRVAALVARAPGTLFVVDEAYRDFLLEGEPWRLILRPNLLTLRSLTKFYHLSGVRIGYVLGPEEWIGRLRARQPTWSVNAVAQALALAFLRDQGFPQRSRAFYRAETPRFIRAVEEAGFSVRPTSVHFFLIDLPGPLGEDQRILRGLLERGLAARHTRNFPSLDGRCLRVATRLPQENGRFAAALKALGVMT